MSATSNPSRARHRLGPVLLAAAVFAVPIVARFVTRSPLWLDEALSVDIARLPIGSIPEALRHDGHPPLYYFLLHWWMELVGEGDVAVRALSGIFGVLSLPLAWLAGRRVGGTTMAWATVLVLALSPYAVRYSTETRMYALVMFLVLAGHLLVRKAVDDERASLRLLAGVAAVTGLLLLTHYWSIYLLAATVLTLGWWGWRRGGAARTVAIRVVLAMAVGGLFFVPWLPSFLEQAAHTGTPWATAARPTVVLDGTLRDFSGGGGRAETGLLAVTTGILLLLGVFARPRDDGAPGLILARPQPAVLGEATVAALTMAIGTLAGLVTDSTFAGRYASVVLPLVVLVVARAFTVIPDRLPLAITALAVLGFSAIGIAGNVFDQRTQAQEFATSIRARFEPGDVILTCPDQLGPATRRALIQAAIDPGALQVYPTGGDGDLIDWRDYTERNDDTSPRSYGVDLATSTDPDSSIWVIWNGSYRTFEGDCEALLAGIATVRGGPRLINADGGARFFEHATLVRYGPAPG